MTETSATAMLLEADRDELSDPFLVSVSRSDLTAAVESGQPLLLGIELEAGEAGRRRLALELVSADARQVLRRTTSDPITLAVDSDGANGLFDPDFEAHGLRKKLAIAVAIAAAGAQTTILAGSASADTTASVQTGSASDQETAGVQPATFRQVIGTKPPIDDVRRGSGTSSG